MAPEGHLPTLFLELLRVSGVPTAVVVVVGTLMALYQFASNLDGHATAIQGSVLSAFASSSRRVRAYAMYVFSHLTATALTVVVVLVIANDPRIAGLFTVSTFSILAAIAAYFMAIDWWSFRHGDTLPNHVAAFVALFGGFVIIAYGLFNAIVSDDWGRLAMWVAIAFFWSWAIGWASSTGSGLARAIQRA